MELHLANFLIILKGEFLVHFIVVVMPDSKPTHDNWKMCCGGGRKSAAKEVDPFAKIIKNLERSHGEDKENDIISSDR